MEQIRRVVVKATHLAREAVVYMRQSTQRQVEENEGSTEHQRNQAEYARQLGWQPEAITVVDEDLGVSGSSTYRRFGYARVLERIKANLIGAVFVAEYSRLGRNLREAITFVDECRMHDVLIVVNGRVHDLRDSRERFMATLFLNFAELENDGLRERLNNGKLAKAMMGIAVSPPPAGYVSHKGKWFFDPDERVRLAVSTVFRIFLAERTLVRTVARLARLGVYLPRRERHELYWVRPDIGAVGFMIKNRSYMGDYVFRKRCVDPALGRSGNGRNRDRLSHEGEMIVVPHHHDAYVSRDEWDEMQRLLANNAPKRFRRNPGPGAAVLQGILKCAKHLTRGMISKYKKLLNGTVHYYICCGDVHLGGSSCCTIPGRPLERAVVTAVIQRLSQPRLDAIVSAWRQAKAEALAERRRGEVELERLREKAVDLERRYMLVDPANRSVAADLESKLEAAKQELKIRDGTQAPVDIDDLFSEEKFDELVQLCADFERLWYAATTEARDRKEILRTLIRHVIIDEEDKERIRVRIVWADDESETPLEIFLTAHAHRLIGELHAQGVDPSEIAKHLNDLQIFTLKFNRWTRNAVVTVLWRWRKRGRPSQRHGKSICGGVGEGTSTI